MFTQKSTKQKGERLELTESHERLRMYYLVVLFLLVSFLCFFPFLCFLCTSKS